MMHLKPAFLFPGQGSQIVGMGRDFYDNHSIARAVFEEADDALGFALSKLIFEGPDDELQLTENTQPAILTMSIAAHRVLMQALTPLGIAPAFAAGHSLGEYTAHVAAGSLSFADAVRTVRARGRFMQNAVSAGSGAMAAILGLTEPQVNDLCGEAADQLSTPATTGTLPSESAAGRFEAARATVSPANLNSLEQIVISGSTEAVTLAVELAKAAGAKKTVLLKVSAPFHCALMQPAADALASTLESIVFSDPAYPIVTNVDARMVTRGADVRDCLIRQVTAPVRWVECMQQLIFEGATSFIEIGPKRVLSNLLRQIDRSQPCFHIEDSASLDKTLTALAAVTV